MSRRSQDIIGHGRQRDLFRSIFAPQLARFMIDFIDDDPAHVQAAMEQLYQLATSDIEHAATFLKVFPEHQHKELSSIYEAVHRLYSI